MSEGWYPEAEQIKPKHVSGQRRNADLPAKGVLHTTESFKYTPSSENFYGHQFWPHMTGPVGDDNIFYQHFSIFDAAYALKYGDHDNVFQLEIPWQAARIKELPEDKKLAIRTMAKWVSHELRIPFVYPQFVAYPRSYGYHAPQRFGLQYWLNFSGWCGHEHVYKNDHGDPGEIDAAGIFVLQEEPNNVNEHLKFYQQDDGTGKPVGPVYLVNLSDGTKNGVEPGAGTPQAVRMDLKRTAGVDDTIHLVNKTTLDQFRSVG